MRLFSISVQIFIIKPPRERTEQLREILHLRNAKKEQ